MSTRARSIRSNRMLLRFLILLGVVLTGVMVASAVFAGWTTISTANSTIDTAWGTEDYSEGCTDLPTAQRDDLKRAWFKYDGTNIYFRVETCASAALSGTNRRAIGGIDCNNDGDFTDPYVNGPDGDRLILYSQTFGVVIRDGALNQLASPLPGDNTDSVGADIEWQIPLTALYPGCRGSVSQLNIKWMISDDLGSILDQSEQYFPHSNPMDFGDTGNPTPANCATPSNGNSQTFLPCNGARHGFGPTPETPLRLGSEALDADGGNLNNSTADADDTTGSTPGDEQGIYPDPAVAWTTGASAGKLLFSISGGVSGSNAYLSCWIDWNKDNDWADGGEQVLNNTSLLPGATSRVFEIPSTGVSYPNTWPARCRLADATGAANTPYGASEFGEVEDHQWGFDANGFFITPADVTDLAIRPSGTNDVKLTWSNPVQNSAARIMSHPTNPYFVSNTVGAVNESNVTAAPWEWTDAGHYAAIPTDSIYYIVLGRVGTAEAAPSNRVGLFEFGLTQGVP